VLQSNGCVLRDVNNVTSSYEAVEAKRFRYSRGGMPKDRMKALRICSSPVNPVCAAMVSIAFLSYIR
jgi:hypothetical protein